MVIEPSCGGSAFRNTCSEIRTRNTVVIETTNGRNGHREKEQVRRSVVQGRVTGVVLLQTVRQACDIGGVRWEPAHEHAQAVRAVRDELPHMHRWGTGQREGTGRSKWNLPASSCVSRCETDTAAANAVETSARSESFISHKWGKLRNEIDCSTFDEGTSLDRSRVATEITNAGDV